MCRLPSGHIRFEKCMALARLVSQILAYKETVVSIILMYMYIGRVCMGTHAGPC